MDPKLQARQYLEQQIQNSTPAQQVVMLYDGAIRFCMKTREAIERGDIEERYNSNARAIEVVSYLLEILDAEKGGELAARLTKIYTHILQHLIRVDVENSVEPVDEALVHLRTLRKAWQQLSQQGLQADAGQEGTPAPKTAKEADAKRTPVRRSATA